MSAEGYLEPPPHKNLEFFLTLVNGWDVLTIAADSSTLDVVKVLDMPPVSEGYVCDLGKSLSVALKEINKT